MLQGRTPCGSSASLAAGTCQTAGSAGPACLAVPATRAPAACAATAALHYPGTATPRARQRGRRSASCCPSRAALPAPEAYLEATLAMHEQRDWLCLFCIRPLFVTLPRCLRGTLDLVPRRRHGEGVAGYPLLLRLWGRQTSCSRIHIGAGSRCPSNRGALGDAGKRLDNTHDNRGVRRFILLHSGRDGALQCTPGALSASRHRHTRAPTRAALPALTHACSTLSTSSGSSWDSQRPAGARGARSAAPLAGSPCPGPSPCSSPESGEEGGMPAAPAMPPLDVGSAPPAPRGGGSSPPDSGVPRQHCLLAQRRSRQAVGEGSDCWCANGGRNPGPDSPGWGQRAFQPSSGKARAP